MDQVMTGGTELSVIVPQFWSAKFYDVLLAALPFNSLIDTSWQGEIAALGDTVKISTVPEFADAIEISEDQRNDAEGLTVTQQSLTINRMVVKDFIVTNKAQLQSLPVMDKLRDLAIYSIQKKMQALIIDITIPSASSPDHQIAYDSSTTLALADILEVKELLDDQDVPASDRHAVMGSAQVNDIFNISGFTSSDFTQSVGLLNSGNMPPALLGFVPHMTTVVGNTSRWFHRMYATMAAQMGMDVSVYDLGVDGKRAARVNCTTLFGLKQLDNTRVVQLS